MESPRFRIESGSIDLTAPEKSSVTKMPAKNFEAEQFDADGIVVKTDNQSTESSPLRFVIEKSLLSMGNVSPNMPSEVSSTLSIAGGRTVYQVLVSESDSLRKLSGQIIPDTVCNPEKKCTVSLARSWDSLSTYGFGYTVEGQDVPNDFMNTDHYRPFANTEKSNKPTTLMNGLDKKDERHSTIKVKTIVSPIQADGTYENTINFMAVPGY